MSQPIGPARINDTDSGVEVKSFPPMLEIGRSGLRRVSGIVQEEFLPQLRGRKAVQIYREMSDNDAIVGALIFAVERLLRQLEWRVEPASNSPEDAANAEFIEQCMDDMCYDDQTEVLTQRGWKLFADLQQDDLVGQRTADGHLEYVLPRAHHVYDFSGELHCIQGAAIDLAVSPNHRLLFAPQYGRHPDRAKQKTQLGIYKARDIHGKRGWMSKKVSWKGTEVALSQDELELMGFAVADGSFSTRQFVLIQKETAYVEDLLARCGLSQRAHRRQVNGSTQWVISDIAMVRKYQEDFGLTSRVKRIPDWLQEATGEQISAFLKGFAQGDGWESATGLTGLYTSSRQLADDLQVLAMKTGRAATVLTRTGSPESFAPGAAGYRVSVWSQRKEATAPCVMGKMWSKQAYDGKIYCVSVPSGIIMVRRNGKAVWSGNSHSFDDLIAEILSMMVYGWSYHEIVYKKRIGPWEKDPKKRSKYTDGKIGWRKIPIRSQETLFKWGFDDDGGIQTMFQMSPPNYETVPLPIAKCLLFRTTTSKNNPEGKSLLRTAYRSWYMKKRMEEFESIGVERDLAGLPVARVPSTYLDAKPGTKEAQMVQAFRKMVQSVRRDENEGIVLPSMFDLDTKQEMFSFELMTSGGSRQFDTNELIQRYEQRILMSTLADFILVGHEQTGSYNMHSDKRGLFQNALNSIAKSISEVFNRYAIPRLFALNGMKPDELPTIVPNDVDPPDITQLGGFMQQMTSAGMQFFPDPALEKFIRDAARLPELDPEQEQVKEMQARQQNIMDLAQQRFESLNMEMQAHQGVQQFQSGEMNNASQANQLNAQQNMPPQDPNAPAQAPPDPGDPQGKHAMAQAGHATAQAGETTNQAKIGTKVSSVKLAQEQQKLQNLKKKPPPPKAKGKK